MTTPTPLTPAPSTSRVRYGPWHGGRDPLEPPYDVAGGPRPDRRATSSPADRPREALRDLLRAGRRTCAGSTTCAAGRAAAPAELRGAGASTARSSRSASCSTRRSSGERALFPDPCDAARMAEAELDAAPADTARAVRALADYAWRSRRGAANVRARSATCCAARCSTASSAGMKDALSRRRPRTCSGSRTCSPTSTRCSTPTRAGEHTQQQFEEFMGGTATSSPSTRTPSRAGRRPRAPRRRRAADDGSLAHRRAARRARRPHARAFGDLDLACEMDRLRRARCATRRPDLDWAAASA